MKKNTEAQPLVGLWTRILDWLWGMTATITYSDGTTEIKKWKRSEDKWITLKSR